MVFDGGPQELPGGVCVADGGFAVEAEYDGEVQRVRAMGQGASR